MELSRRTVFSGVVVLVAIVLVSSFTSLSVFSIGQLPARSSPGLYDSTTVTISDGETNRTLGRVDVRLAETEEQRYTGLSDTSTLAAGSGMLFVYGREEPRTFVMREMDYPLDIVFIGADGQINAIAQAPAPGPGQDGNDIRRSGIAKWVLEVPRGWMAEHGVSAGDRLLFE